MKKVAIVGSGQIAETVHAAYYNSKKENFQLVAVVNPNTKSASEFGERLNISKFYETIDEMLTVEKPDIVSICTPNHFHYENTIKALEAGAHVFCEKPPAMHSSEAKHMYMTARKNSLCLSYNFQHRYSEEAQMIKAHQEILGEIYFTDAFALRRSGVPGWGNFIDKDLQGGGPLIDYGIHMLDTALYILGFPEIRNVKAHQFQKIGTKKSKGTFGEWDPEKYTVEDSLFGNIEFKNGSLLRINTSFALNIEQEKKLDIQFCGEDGGANLYPGKIYKDIDGELLIIKEIQADASQLIFKGINRFGEAVLNNSFYHMSDAEEGYVLQKVIELLYLSAKTGECIEYES